MDCFEVMNPGVVLDCAGYSIIGDGTPNSIAVLNNRDGFTIKNCQFTRFAYAVFNAEAVDYQIVKDNAMAANTHLSVYAQGNNHEITGNSFASPRGVYSPGLDYSLISENEMDGGWTKRNSPVSAGVLLEGGSSYNEITGNEITRYHEGIAFECPQTCRGNELTNNQLLDNKNNGVILVFTENTLISENTITETGLGAGIQLYDADSTNVTRNLLDNPRNLWVRMESNGNTAENNRFIGGAGYFIQNNATTTVINKNYYADILTTAIYDSNNDGFGDCGQAYPYNAGEPKWLGYGADYNPAGAKRINEPITKKGGKKKWV
jgi:parallel beta-helix repeat protein